MAAGCTVPGNLDSEIDAMVTSAVLDTRVGPIFFFFPRKRPNKQEQAHFDMVSGNSARYAGANEKLEQFSS